MITLTSTEALGHIRNAILAITPTYAHHSDVLWTPSEVREVEVLRRFYLDMREPASWVRDDHRVWGVGEHHRFPIDIIVGYGGLTDQEQSLRGHLCTEDKVDLWRALHHLIGTVDGLIECEPDEPQMTIERDGDRWPRVVHHYLVGYMQATA